MTRYLMPILIVLVLVSVFLLGCGSVPSSEPKSTQTPTTSELQTQVETLQEELNQLKEQKRAETLQQAEAYYAIVKYGSEVSAPTSIGPVTVEAITESLKASSKFWSLIKATEDPYLISLCQPNEWGVVACSYSRVKGYAEGKYRELMSEYYSQQYIDDQLSMLEQSTEKTAENVVTPKPEVEKITPKPEVDVTIVVEYEGKWSWQAWRSFVWHGTSGNNSRTLENKRVPVEWWAQIDDEGTGPLILKILYNGQVVAQDTAIGQDDIAYVFWEGP